MKFKLKVFAFQEMGQRKCQEDTLFPNVENISENDRLFLLCDGMGGRSYGDIASQTVCEVISKEVIAHAANDNSFADDIFLNALSASFDALDEKDTDDSKMGTTLAFLKFHNEGATIAHLGDSRIYQIRPGSSKNYEFRTEDHSLVNDLVRVGEMTPEEARRSSQRNILTRAIQAHRPNRSRAEIYHTADIQADDYFFLCSDGMIELMDDQQLNFILTNDEYSDVEKIQILKRQTEFNHDNHSAILVHIIEVLDDDDKVIAAPMDIEVETEPAPIEEVREDIAEPLIVEIEEVSAEEISEDPNVEVIVEPDTVEEPETVEETASVVEETIVEEPTKEEVTAKKPHRPEKLNLYDDHEDKHHRHHEHKEKASVRKEDKESLSSKEETKKTTFLQKIKAVYKKLKTKFITLCSPLNRAVRDYWNSLPEKKQKQISLAAAVLLVLFAILSTYFYFFTSHRSYDPLRNIDEPVNVTDTLTENDNLFGDAPKSADPNAFKEAPATVDTARSAAPTPIENQTSEEATATPATPSTPAATATPAESSTTPATAPAKAETPAAPAKQTNAEPVGAPDEH